MPLMPVALGLVIVGVALAIAAIPPLTRSRVGTFAARAIIALVFLIAGLGLGVVAIGVRGLQPLAGEQLAARVNVRPTGPQRFAAMVHFADGHDESFDLAGDAVYIDAHIIKWTPLANLLGLATSYRLERIGGRYDDLGQENTALRTVFDLGDPQLVDLAALGRRFPLGLFFDAEYGSTTYVPVLAPATLALQVSTTGLLFRPAEPAPTPTP
jgi:hypothetical protein